MPLGQPSYSATSVHSRRGVMRKIRPKGMSVTKRLPSRSNDGPSRKQSTSWPGLLASDHSVRRLRRKASGSRVSTRASITCGGAKARFHMASSVELDAGVAHRGAPLSVLGLDEGRELRRRAAEGRAAVFGELVEQLLPAQRVVGGGIELADDGRRGSHRAYKPGP